MEKVDYGSDVKLAVLGVEGRLTHATRKPGQAPGLWFKQAWVSTPRPIAGYGTHGRMMVEIRFDDSCGNGHNSFAITASVYTDESSRRRDCAACGCLHEDIARVFPELAGLIQWHLWSTDGGLHYIANAAYHASNRDHHGCLAGEPWAWDEAVRFGPNPILHKLNKAFAKFLQDCRKGVHGEFDFEVIRVDHKERGHTGKYQFGPKFTFGGYGKDWHQCPFDSEDEAMRFLRALQTCEPTFQKVACQWGEGKVRDFEAARNAANWPEATEEELSSPNLKEMLAARLPDLLRRFKADVEACGLRWEPR